MFLIYARKKTGTSSNVIRGILKQSQKRTNLAALTDASISSTPAKKAGWLATMPTEKPPSRAKPITILGAKCS
jgi:hypothetical protein